MKIVAIIQARMGSTRLPGKVMQDIGSRTMLSVVVRRVQQAKLLNEVVVATSTIDADRPVVQECVRLGVPAFRGSEEDVLARYYQASKAHHADTVVRITADCPLIDPEVVDLVVEAFLRQSTDYASNTLQRTFPRGLDTEVMTAAGLHRAWREAQEPYQRTHVTPYLYQNPELFRLLNVTWDHDYSDQRWTVDTPEDLAFIRSVYSHFGHKIDVPWQDVIGLLADEPGLAEMNRHIRQKTLHEG